VNGARCPRPVGRRRGRPRRWLRRGRRRTRERRRGMGSEDAPRDEIGDAEATNRWIGSLGVGVANWQPQGENCQRVLSA
jgi:hypothetical protein